MNNDKIEQWKTIEDILKSIDFMDIETLRETIAYIIKIYIIDKGISYDGNISDSVGQDVYSESPLSAMPEKTPIFFELIQELKNKYTVPELNMFTIENQNVFINIEGRNHLISNKVNNRTVQSISHLEEVKKADSNPDEDFNQPNTLPGRFKNLEME
ncbi:MAG: hypothetical protein SVR08_12520 [Spirochaetota bacterium]|nr:hypothetical protein [Spirochaetota bacterium]